MINITEQLRTSISARVSLQERMIRRFVIALMILMRLH